MAADGRWAPPEGTIAWRSQVEPKAIIPQEVGARVVDMPVHTLHISLGRVAKQLLRTGPSVP